MAVGQVQPAQVQYEIVFKVRGQLNFQTPLAMASLMDG